MRILLKLSWEALSWNWNWLFEIKILNQIVESLKEIKKKNIEIAIFIWWWNIFRGKDGENLWIDRVTRDYMWMLSTIINWLALSEYLEKNWLSAKLLTSTWIDCVWERFDKKKALKYLNKKNILIFAGWMWNPYFTTDTGWVLRALEIEADMIIKLTWVDGVYNKDPKKHKDAIKFDKITYDEVLSKNLKVMDSTAIALAREEKLVLKVINLFQRWSVLKAILWENIWTTIY